MLTARIFGKCLTIRKDNPIILKNCKLLKTIHLYEFDIYEREQKNNHTRSVIVTSGYGFMISLIL